MRQQPAAVCAVGWIGGSGGLVAALRGGAGDAAEGDFEAEGAEFADVVGDLPAGVTLALVVVGAEVFIPGAGARQQRVVDLQLGVADGDACFGVAAAAGQPPVAGALAGGGLAGRDGGLTGDGGQVPVAFLGLGFSLALSGGVVQRGAPGPGGQVGAGGEPAALYRTVRLCGKNLPANQEGSSPS